MTLAIYVDSVFFVTIAAVLSQGFGPNTSVKICANTVLLCLIFYMSTKVSLLSNSSWNLLTLDVLGGKDLIN